ncbi:MAG: ComF family protein [Flavobacteriia bacterium]|nr:ComF family protein [Flavobacteriia bacterium]
MSTFRLKNLLKLKEHLFHLIYPNSCVSCQNELIDFKDFICPFCAIDLKFTYYEKFKEPTELDQLFWGRVHLKATYSMFYFEKGKKIQPILHALKYKDKPKIGVQLGKKMGEKIKNIEAFKDLNALIPVPLHSQKLFLRGYNQSEKLADGIALELNIPVITDLISRTKNTESQTKKGKLKRWENVENKFSSSKNKAKNLKHIAIIDDVITTGATLEAIIREIQKNNPDLCISVISLALAK